MKRLSLLILILTAQASMNALPQQRAQTPGPARATRPNILFILADDYGAESSPVYPALYNAGATSGYGQAATPTLSKLAARGLVFDNAWVTPVCSPTRAALLTGLYGHNTSVTTVGNRLPGTTTSIFELLSGAALTPRYSMGVFGKWHLAGNTPGQPGIDHVMKETGVPFYKGLLGGLITDYYSWTLDSTTAPSAPISTYSTTALTDFAIDFVRNQKGNEPWFVYLPYNAPHGTAPGDGFQVPPQNLFTVDVGGKPAGNPAIYNGNIPVYQAVVQALDTEIGRLFRAMEETGQLDNTVIIFMGDNGTPVSVKDNAASRIRGSKATVYEGGLRVPLIIAGAGVTRTGRESHIISSPDMYATIASLAGIPLTNNSINNSYSVAPLLRSSNAKTGRMYSFSELCPNTGAGMKQFAIRDQRYKLLFNGAWQMFDLESDPWEQANIYDKAENTKERATLLSELRSLKMKATTGGCFIDIPSE